jgi:hypothetical protein
MEQIAIIVLAVSVAASLGSYNFALVQRATK